MSSISTSTNRRVRFAAGDADPAQPRVVFSLYPPLLFFSPPCDVVDEDRNGVYGRKVIGQPFLCDRRLNYLFIFPSPPSFLSPPPPLLDGLKAEKRHSSDEHPDGKVRGILIPTLFLSPLFPFLSPFPLLRSREDELDGGMQR